MSKRKQKLIIGFCAPVAAICLATGTAGLIIGLKNNNKPDIPPLFNQNNISFNAVKGAKLNGKANVQVEAGTTFDKVDKPEVICSASYKFGGWVDENGDPVHGRTPIRSDYKLTPVLLNAGDVSEYATIKFEPGTDPVGVKLQGNTTVSVTKNHRFYMVNRPSASVKDATGRKWTFKGWMYKTNVGTHKAGDLVGENDSITTDVTLIPKFKKSVTITWDPGESPAKIDRGSTTTTAEVDSTFKEFNQPQISNGEKYFDAWYKDDVSIEANRLTENTIIDQDMTVVAKWTAAPAPDQKYVTLHFNAPDIAGTEFTITPSAYVLAEKGQTTFEKINKPTIVDANKNYRLSTKGEAQYQYKSGDNWYDITDPASTTFTEATEIRPIMEYAVDDVLIDGESTLLPESNATYKATIEGGTKSEEVTWKIFYDSSCEEEIEEPTIASINSSTGVLTIGDPTDTTQIYVQAISTVGNVKSSPFEVTITMPYVDSSDIWYYNNGENRWMYFTQEDLCDASSTTLQPKYIDGTSATAFDKANDFMYDLIFGDRIKIASANFLSGWTGFNGTINLNNVLYIEESFLAGCTSFNQTLNLDKIVYIAPNFLANCTSFDSTIDMSNNKSLYEIGDDFMIGCTLFNSQLVLPSTASLTIGNNFMQNCSSFSQNLVLGSNIIYLGDFFMNGCDSYTGKITVNATISDSTCPGSTYCFISSNKASAIATTGFSVDGTNAEAFTAKFPTQLSVTNAYRVLTTTQGHLTEDEWNAALAQASSATRVKDEWTDHYYYLNPDTGTKEKEETDHTIHQKDTLTIDGVATKVESFIKYSTEDPTEVESTRYIKQDPTTNVWFDYYVQNKGLIDQPRDYDKTLNGEIDEMVAMIASIPYSNWTFNGATSAYEYEIGGGSTISLKFDNTTKLIHEINVHTEKDYKDRLFVEDITNVIDTNASAITLPEEWNWQNPYVATYDSTSKTSSYTFTGGMSNDKLEWVVFPISDYESTFDKYKEIKLTTADGIVPSHYYCNYDGSEHAAGDCIFLWRNASPATSDWMDWNGAGTWEEGWKFYQLNPLSTYENVNYATDKVIMPIRPVTATTKDTTVTFGEAEHIKIRGEAWETSGVSVEGKEFSCKLNSEGLGNYFEIDPLNASALTFEYEVKCAYESETSGYHPELNAENSYIWLWHLDNGEQIRLSDKETLASHGITLTVGQPTHDATSWSLKFSITFAASTLQQYNHISMTTLYQFIAN